MPANTRLWTLAQKTSIAVDSQYGRRRVGKNHQLLPSLRSGLAATRHPFRGGLHYAKAAANQLTVCTAYRSAAALHFEQSQQPVQSSEPLRLAESSFRLSSRFISGLYAKKTSIGGGFLLAIINSLNVHLKPPLKMSPKNILICSVLSSFAFVCLANGQYATAENHPRAVQMMSLSDNNGDGQISKAEFMARAGSEAEHPRLDRGFNMFDADKNGFVTYAELNARFKLTNPPVK